MEEQYIKIEGLENYSISNFGNIRNDIDNTILPFWKNKHGYNSVFIDKNNAFTIHRLVGEVFIPNPLKKPIVDHIDTCRTNNRVDNLRWVTIAENNYNKSIQKRNKSGYKGVGFDKRRNKWVASVKKNGKSYYLGGFTDKQEAIRVRQLKANELFGEFTHQSERIVNVNIKIPKNTKLNINIVVEDDEDEEYKLLEQEFLEKLK